MSRLEQCPSSAFARIAVLLFLLVTAMAARAQTLRVLHTFTGKPDGSLPYAGLVRDGAGNLYGTTYRGGVNGCGMVFEMAHSGSGWIERPLYSFGCEGDGDFPYAPVVIGPDGSLYGTTEYGGGSEDGIVFKLSPPPNFCRSFTCPGPRPFCTGSLAAATEGSRSVQLSLTMQAIFMAPPRLGDRANRESSLS